MSELSLEGLTIKEECPLYQKIKENREVPAGIENPVTNIVKQKIETLTVKNEINPIEDSKIKVENFLHPVVRIQRNFELEKALKGEIKSEPQVSVDDKMEDTSKEASPSAGGSQSVEGQRDQPGSPTPGTSNDRVIDKFWLLTEESYWRRKRLPYNWKGKLKSLEAEQKTIAVKLLNDVFNEALSGNLSIHSRIANDPPDLFHGQFKPHCVCQGPPVQNRSIDGHVNHSDEH